jgi:predicted transcriptional regulator
MVAFTLRLNNDLALRLSVVAAAEGRSKTDVVREALTQYLKANEEDAFESLEDTIESLR